MLKRFPLVVILGGSGSGKTKLSVDLAKYFGGEVISADSMQVYRGLDILTNKVTKDEMHGVPHHMINIADRNDEFNVVQYRDKALPIIHEIQDREKIPFIVGGTNYYIESLLWSVLVNDTNETKIDVSQDLAKPHLEQVIKKLDVKKQSKVKEIISLVCKRNVTEKIISDFSNEDFHQALMIVDEERAKRLHPNDKRKVFRSLQIWGRTGKKHSNYIKEQQHQFENTENDPGLAKNSRHLGADLRFQNCICLWIQVSSDVLFQRIDERTQEMVNKGLRKEIDDYILIMNSSGCSADFERGLMQSIGFKEFIQYIKLSDDERSSSVGDSKFHEGVERLKISTKQYVRKQTKWIKQRFLKSSRRILPSLFWLDGNDLSQWAQNVTSVSKLLIESFISDPENSILQERKVQCTPDHHTTDLDIRECKECNIMLLGADQYEIHLKSNRHKKKVRSLKKIKRTIT